MKDLKAMLVAMVVVVLSGQAFGQTATIEASPAMAASPAPVAAPAAQIAPAPPVAPAALMAQRVIVVSLEDRKLALVEDGHVKKVYGVAVGKPSTPSPTGTFTIERRVENPTYHHDGRTVLPGPRNPVGTRWMGLSIRGYGIHGTNEPKSIGKAASHGCIRMAKGDLEELYASVAVGDTVELVGERNDETARLFGQAAAAQTLVASAGAQQAAAAVQGAMGQASGTEKAVPAGAAGPAQTAMQ